MEGEISLFLSPVFLVGWYGTQGQPEQHRMVKVYPIGRVNTVVRKFKFINCFSLKSPVLKLKSLKNLKFESVKLEDYVLTSIIKGPTDKI